MLPCTGACSGEAALERCWAQHECAVDDWFVSCCNRRAGNVGVVVGVPTQKGCPWRDIACQPDMECECTLQACTTFPRTGVGDVPGVRGTFQVAKALSCERRFQVGLHASVWRLQFSCRHVRLGPCSAHAQGVLLQRGDLIPVSPRVLIDELGYDLAAQDALRLPWLASICLY